MKAFFYGVALQFKLDIRSKSLLITCYIVPLIFFALMGGIFTSITPDMKHTLIQSMVVMGVSMGAFIGFPASIVETYGSDIKKVYTANGIPLYFGLLSMSISAFIHLMIMCTIILVIAPIAFHALLPSNLPLFYLALAIFILVSLGIGSILGLVVKNQSKLTMISQLIFLPSIMLSGIMFPIDMLPKVLEGIGMLFPAYWGYKIMLDNGLVIKNLWVLIVILVLAILTCIFFLKRRKKD